jgi:D-aminopeptidase
VDFVDNIDLEMALARGVTNVVAQLANLLHAVVARTVDFQDVEAITRSNFLAAIANAAGRNGRAIHAIECFGQDARRGRFPDSARANKQIGVSEPVLFDRILERPRDVRLADKVVKSLRAILSRKNLVAHRPNLIRFIRARKQKTENRKSRSGGLQTADPAQRFVNRRSLVFGGLLLAMPNPSRLAILALLSFISPLLPAREPQTSPPPTQRVRARALGIPFEGTPGPLDAITDVAGVEVGYTTLVSGEGKMEVGKGPVRTGVTAILPRGKNDDPVYAASFSLNGNGEMTGTAWIEEGGFLEGPVAITNTHSVGVVRDAIIDWRVKKGGADPGGFYWSLPVVAETWDGWLNDVNGFHVKPEHVFNALNTAHGGAIEEGSVGGGTGMVCYEFKGGTGTASRKVDMKEKKESPPRTFTVGVLLQANFGRRSHLTIAGVPVGKEIPGEVYKRENGSCIAVVATDAPLLPHQLKRLARRVSLGLARTGTVSGNGSGDLFLAFSTANPEASNPDKVTRSVETIPNDRLDPIFDAVVQATEEAVVNALIDNQSMTGRDDHRVEALSHERMRELLKKYNRGG